MGKVKKKRKLRITLRGITLTIVIAAYILLIVGSFYWSDNHYFKAISPFADFPLTEDGKRDGFDLFLRIIGLCFVIISITDLVRFILNLVGPRFKKGRSLASLLSSFAKYVGAIILIFTILSTLGVDTTVLLASAGILSLVVGLGAQPLIEDIFAGVFIVFEHTFDIGDIIVVDGFRGTVKEMGVRTTKIEDAGGDVKVINNSDIRTLINMTSKLSTAICDVSIGYNEDIKKVEEILNINLPKIKEKYKTITNGPTYLGVQSLADSGVIIRIVADCNELVRYQVQRDINRELKIIFDENNITIPYPQIVIHQSNEENN